MEVQFDFVLRTSAATKTEDPRLTWAITSDHPDCYSYPRAVTIEIYGAVQAQETYSPYLSRTMQSAEGLTLPCEYTYTFPENEDGPWARWERYQRVGTQPPYVHVPYTGANTVVRTPCAGDDVEWNEDRCDPPIRLFYRRAAISRFEPQIAISVPATPAGGFVGETFAVTFSALASAPLGCTNTATARYLVEAGSTTAVPDPNFDLPLLVHDPDTTAAGHTCGYDATFPSAFSVTHADGSTTTLSIQGSTHETITNPDQVTRSYQSSSRSSPTTTIKSTTMTTTTTTTEPPPPTTTSTSTTMTTTTTTTEPESPTTTTSTSTTMTTTTTTTTTEPPRTASTFAPMVSVSVPRLAGVSGDNIWEGETFEATLERASGADSGCDLGTAVTVTYTVQADGTMMDDGTLPATLKGTLADGLVCAYTVTFPPAPIDSPGGDFDWTMTPAAATEVRLDALSHTATATYTVGAVTFAPDATITVPGGSNGKSFEVSVTSATTGCSGNPTAVTLTYGVTAATDTTAVPSLVNQPLVAYPAGASASTDVCVYTAEFPTNEVEPGAALVRQDTPVPDTMFTGTDQSMSVTYTAASTGGVPPSTTTTTLPPLSHFDPTGNFELRVPYVDPHAHGDNLLGPEPNQAMWPGSGAIITVTYRVAANQHVNCTAEATQRYEIGIAYHQVRGGDVNALTPRARLVDAPVAGEQCNYVADWRDSFTHTWRPGSAQEQIFGPYYVNGDNRVFKRGDLPISVQYGDRLFTPTIPIGVPDDERVGSPGTSLYAEADFYLRLRSTPESPASCPHGANSAPGALQLTVNSSGVVTWAGDSPLLVNVPAGAETDEQCAYRVWYPPELTATGAATGTWALVLQGSRSETVSASKAAPRRTYVAGPSHRSTFFSPTVTVSVPYIGTGPNANQLQLQGAVIYADYAPTSTSPAGCTDSDFDYFTVSSSGSFSTGGVASAPVMASRRALLVRRPMYSASDCLYRVTFTSSWSRSGRSFGIWSGQGMEFRANQQVRAAYEAATTFIPKVLISVPQINVNIGGTVKNLFSDVLTSAPSAPAAYGPAKFQVDFDRSGGPVSGCSDESAMFTVQANGTVTGDAPALIDRLTPTGPRCVYAVTFQTTNLLGGLAKVSDPTDDNSVDNSVMAGSVSARAKYSTTDVWGTLSADVTTPAYTGTARTATVTVGRAAGSSTSCRVRPVGTTAHVERGTFTVPLDQDGSTSVAYVFDYVDFPAGATSAADRCIYDVGWGRVTSGSSGQRQPSSSTSSFIGSGRAGPTCSLFADYRRHGTAGRATNPGDRACSTATTFTPDVSITLPFIDLDGVAGHDFYDEQFRIGFTRNPSDNDANCTEEVDAVYLINMDGEVILMGTRHSDGSVTPGLELVGQHSAPAVECRYTVNFRSNDDFEEDGDWAMRDTQISGSDPVARARYVYAQGRWEPVVEIDVPFRDENNDDTNDYTARFQITFTRTSAASTDSPVGSCPSSASSSVRIGAAGILNANGNQLLARGTLTRSGGFSAGCEFSVTFPDTMASGVSGVTLTRASGSPATVTVSSSSSIAASDYGDGRTTFESGIRFNGFDATAAGTDFTVTYTNHSNRRLSHAACELHDSLDQETFEVQADGSVRRTSAAAPLINTPAGANLGCRYSIGWPEVPGWSRDSGSVSTIRASDPNPVGTYSTVTAPVAAATQVSAGGGHSCALLRDGSVVCWGLDDDGRSTSSTTSSTSTTPSTTVPGSMSTTSTTSSTSTTTTTTVPRPTLEAGASYTQVSAGNAHTCALKTDGTVACWGSNVDGRSTPPQGAFTQVSAGGGHSCALRRDGSVACWGSDDDGRSTPPQGAFTQVSAGGEHSCGVKADGTVACWGNDGQGRAAAPDESFTQVSVGAFHSCGVKTDGAVACWGFNGNGQTNSPSGTFTQVSAGSVHTCGIRSGGPSDGTVTCWGSNGGGRTIPPQGATFTQLSAGGSHTCGVKIDGSVVCWGDDRNGQSSPPAFLQVSAPPSPTTWNPRVEIYTSFRDIDGDGNNDYNPLFNVVLTRASDSGPAGADCPQTITLAPRIGSAGADGSNGNQIIAGATHSQAVRADCRYDVEWDSSGILTGVTGDDGSEVDLQRIGGDNRINADDPVANRIFRDKSLGGPGTLRFDPPLTAAPAGTVFEVRYVATSASPAACRLPTERDSETYTIGANGVPTETASEKWVAFNNFNFGMLLNRPAHGGGDCRYTLDLPDIEGYTKPTNPPIVTSTGNATVTYAPVGGTRFTPAISIVAPSVDVDGTAGHDFVGARFEIVFNREAGSHDGCSPDNTTLTWTISSTGTVRLETGGTLIDIPAGATAATRCAYSVDFPINASAGYTRVSADDTTISNATQADNAAFATYETSATTFAVTFGITGPAPVLHAAHGEGIRVSPANQRTASWSYARQTNTSMRCSADTSVRLSEEFGSQGSIARVATGIVDFPRGYTTVADRCVYDVTWDDAVQVLPSSNLNTHPFALHDILLAGTPAASTMFSGSTPGPTATYEMASSTFEPNIDITVPSVEGLTAGENLFAGTTFDVNFTRVTGSHADCSAQTTVTATYTVQTNGDVTGTPPTLADLPARHSARCVYDVTTPISKTSVTDAALTWALTRVVGATTSVNGGAIAVDADYTVGKITFTPDVTITVPSYDRDGQTGTNFFTGRTFRVSFTRSAGPASGCSALTETYVVAANGSVAPQDGVEPSLVHFPSASATSECVYDVTFHAVSGTGPTLSPQSIGLDANTRASATAAGITYRAAQTTFRPTIAITVPDVDGLTTDESLFAGTTFGVGFTRATGSHADCSAATTVTVTYTVQTNGTVTGTPPPLVDRPAGQDTRCVYNVTLPSARSATANAPLGWMLSVATGATAATHGGAADVSASYTVGAVTFAPLVTIDVPQYNGDGAQSSQNAFTGRTLTVGFVRSGGPASGCAAASEIYEVNANGDVTAQDGSDPRLTHLPDAETSAACVYDVTYPVSTGTAPALERQTTDLDATTQAADATTSATYEAATTMFNPDVTVEVPYIDSSGNNALAAQAINVSYAPVATPTQHAECTASASETYTIGNVGTEADGGEVTLTTAAAVLVDRPSGETTRCRYRADFDDSLSGGGEGPFNLAADLRDFTKAVPITAIYSADTYFAVDATIEVPDYDRDGAAGTNYYTGAKFTVSFARSAGPTSGCSDAIDVVYVIQPNRAALPNGGTPALIGTVDGEPANCEYTATFPSSVNSDASVTPSWVLRNQGAATATVSAGSASVARTYLADVISFAPNIEIAVPDDDGLTVNESLFVDTTLSVRFTRVAAAHTECSAETSVSVAYTVQVDGRVTGTPPSLTDRPAGQTSRCVYDVVFDAMKSAPDGAELSWTLTREPGATTSANGGAADVSASYTVGAIGLTPDVRVTVPQIDGTTANMNAFAGATFNVRYVKKSGVGPATGCSAITEQTATYTVVDAGTVTGSVPTLTYRPAGVESSCEYEVTFPSSVRSPVMAALSWTLTGPSEPLSLRPGYGPVSGAYTVGAVTFTPAVAIEVPQYNGDGAQSSQNAFTGRTLEVNFVRSAGPLTGCVAVSETYEVSATGAVTAQDGSDPSLVHVPSGDAPSDCVYQVTYQHPVGADPALQRQATGLDATTRATDAATAAVYRAAQTSFVPTIAISVPPVEGLTTSENLFAGTTFDVGFTRVASSHAHCSAATQMNVTYTVQTNGTVTGVAPSLVDRPAGEHTRCVYDVSFPSSRPSASNAELEWTLTRAAGATASTHGGAAEVSASYTVGVVTFTPDVTIDVPQYNGEAAQSSQNAFTGRTLDVSFARSGGPTSGCATANEIYEVTATGAVVAQDGVEPQLTHFPDGDTSAGCVYAVTYPTRVGADPALERQAAGLDVVTLASDTTTAATYQAAASMFSPSIPISVPQIEGLTAGENVFAGATIDVSFRRASGAHRECSAATALTVTYTVAANGTVTGTPPSLVDRPAGEVDRCEYDVTFEQRVSSQDDAALGWTLTRGVATSSVNGGSSTARCNYEVGPITFTPTVDIDAPQYNGDGAQSGQNAFTGRTFGVTFARSGGPARGCVGASEPYIVDADGSVVPRDGTPPSLVHLPAGETSGGCVYSVSYAPTAGSDPPLRRQASGLDATTQASDTATSATYHADETSFSPTVPIEVPDVDGLTANENLFAGTTIGVSFQRAAGSHTDCSAATPMSVPYTVQADGRVTGTPPRLVDRPAGQAGRCDYDVRFDEQASAARDAPLDWDLTRQVAGRSVHGGSSSVPCEYGVGDVSFSPQVDIEVPPHKGDGEQATQSAFTGQTLDVSFTPADASQRGCSSLTKRYVVRPDGSVVPEDGREPSLAHFPDGDMSSECTYNVEYHAGSGGSEALGDHVGESDMQTHARDTATTVTYQAAETSFTPTIVITVPQVDGLTQDENLFADTAFDVGFTQVTGSHEDCSAPTATTVTYAVQANGSVTGTPPRLVDRPAGETARCVYDVTTTPSRASANGAALRWTLTRAAGATTSTHGGRDVVRAHYDVGPVTFTPAVAIAVPQYNGDVAQVSQNAFTGRTFEVTFARSAGATTGCASASETYVIASDGTVAPQDGSDPSLVHLPYAQAQTGCVYSVTYPARSGTGPALERQVTDLDASTQATDTATAATYHAAETSFTPAIEIAVPPLEGMTEGKNLFAGTSLAVSFTKASGAHDDCDAASAAAVPYVVQVNGSVTGTPPSLVDRPSGQATRCSYDLSFDASATSVAGAELGWRLTRGAVTASVTGGAAAGTATYAAGDVTYLPETMIAVPQYNGDGAQAEQNAFAGEEIAVSFSSTSDDCENATLTFVVQATGEVSPESAPTRLVAYPSGSEVLCSYDVAFARNETAGTRLVLQPDSSNSVSGVRQTIRARYRAAASTFAPAVAINVPYVDVDSDGANDLATQTVTVNYVPFGALEQNDDCTPDATETYTVGDGGTAAEGGQLTRTTSAASLVDRPAGESVRCRYVADFTDSVSDGALATFDLAADARQFTNSVPVTVTYSGDTFFVVDATIAVPRYDRDGSAAVNFYEGAALDISFSQKAGTGQVSGCSESTTVKYVVQIDGSVLPDGGPPALVNVPDGQTDSCTYVAAFADAVTSAPGASPAWTLNRLSTQPATTDVSAAAASISRNYEAEAITFEPTVELSVPYVDGLTVGESAFAGTTFEVGFTREPGVHPDCSAATAETATYAVQANGVVTGTPPSLVDRPAGESERCAYDVTTPASRSAANDATLGWTLSRLAALTSVSGDTTAAAHYEVGDVTFTPAVTIEVPQYNGDGARSTENAFTGRTFTVRFSPVVDAETTCATVTETYAVASDGSVGPMDGTPPSLVHVPANDSTSECHYEVTYPTSAGDAPALNLQASARDVTTRARDVAASATYEASETTFVPSVTITVPTIDGLVANKSLFASARFDVRFTQAADARVDCSAVTPVSVTYTVENDGAVAGKPPTLVDRPAGETTRCAYDVAVESSKLSSAGAQLTWELTRGASTASVNGGALEASASYTVGDVTYVPDASISVPQYNGDGAQSTQNAFTGERLSVSFTSATNGCDDATLTFVVRANGSVTLETTATDLIAYPDGSTDLCAYTVAFPPNEVGGTRLALAAGSSTSVTATAQAIRARYAAGATTFQPTVSVAVPFADADGDGNNDFASETIEVSYAPVAGLAQHSGCTPSATETYTIGNGGSASAGGRLSLTSSPASLVDRPAGETRRCRYAADFDDSVSHSASTAADLAADRREFTSEVPVKATYSQDKYFTATLDIDVPDYDRDGRTSSNYFEGAIFGVVFTKKQNIGPATGCSEPTRIRYVVLHDGSVAPDGGAPALIDEPDGGTGRCVYETTFPTALRSTPRATQRWTLRNQGSSVSDIQAASGSVGRTYLADATVFAPTVAIAVPRVDGLTAGANLFADTTFDVDFVRTAGSHDDCSARTTVSVTYTAQAAAAVTGAPPVLVDRPAKQVGRCSYEVATPATRRSASGAALRWALTRDAGATESVDGERSTITADYSVGAVTFTPAVDIEVPQYNGDGLASARNAFAGRTLDVTFGRSAGPGTGCSAVTERYVVAVDGSVAPQDGTAPSLIHRPATEAIDHCEYTVTYPATSGAVPSLNRQSAGLDVTSRAIDAATSVTYHASQTTFDPTATITVPPVAGLTVGENLFADTEFEVRLERTTSAHPDCSAVAATSSTFVVQTAGSVLGTLPAALVDRPAGQTARCPYAVAMPPTVESPESSALGWVLSLDEGATSSLDGGSLAVTAAYTVGAVTFTPAVNITVPQVAGVGAQAEQNLYEGRTFEVSFTRSAGPAEGCLSVSQTYVVTAVGSVVPLDEIEPVLVHLPAGETSNHCVYRVTYPINSGAGPQLARQSAGLDITTRASEPATAAAYQVVTPQSASVGRGAARGGSSRGGGGRSGGGSIGPWQLVASSRAPVSVSLSVPEDGIAVGAPIEMMLNVPGTCGDDLTAFDGLAAEIGLVYALSVETGATVDVIANARLRLVGYAERGTQQRPCVLRVTLVAAPTDCRLEDASTDDDGRSYVEAAWSDDAQTFNLSPALVCDVGEVEGAAAAAAARASLW